ncbi:VOC family protein [Amorphus orientalis]|uniref:Glyoxalase superfamily protein PhnB n=1 Tax=Amorphus orientalis TaxID=649198 RepID=A0AAE4AR19_9HYPH|nr:VOC family protein [Amorphus orientalis]MDQ0314696.1 putative glyoxalase superfamily protein PhnB [Amorphus orientalis]
MTTDTPIEAPRLFATFRFRDAHAMIDWLKRVLGFTEHAIYTADDGSVVHAQLAFGSAMIMVGQVRDDGFGDLVGAPGTGDGKAMYMAVPDVDAAHARARDAGATIVEEPTGRDYGSREFTCRDPEGSIWALGTYWPKAHEPADPA